MSKIKFQFISGTSPKYKALGYSGYEPIEVDEQELDRIKSNGYNVEVLSKAKPKEEPKEEPKVEKKESKKKLTKK